MKRQSKFYRKNEAEVMKMLGLLNTKNSGAGWIEKEDGYNDKIICQLKSTDKDSIKINKIDIGKLENNALISHKIPVFAIQFINKEIYLLIKPIDISTINQYLKTGNVEKEDIINVQDVQQKKVKKIKSNSKKRTEFFEQRKRNKTEKEIKNFIFL